MITRLLARVASHPAVTRWLVVRSMRTPYKHLTGYMNRYWLFNPYAPESDGRGAKYKRLPSVRIHHILRKDLDRAHHDHPWDARTVILFGWYKEIRLENGQEKHYFRYPGDTARINFGEYHTITEVSKGGVWTLFITWPYKGTWGFLVDGVKVPWRDYLVKRDGAEQ